MQINSKTTSSHIKIEYLKLNFCSIFSNISSMYKSNSNIKRNLNFNICSGVFFIIQRLTKRWESPERIRQEHSASLGTPAQRIHSAEHRLVEGLAPQELSVCECPQNTASLYPSDIFSLSSPVWKISKWSFKRQPPPQPIIFLCTKIFR